MINLRDFWQIKRQREANPDCTTVTLRRPEVELCWNRLAFPASWLTCSISVSICTKTGHIELEFRMDCHYLGHFNIQLSACGRKSWLPLRLADIAG